MNSSGRNRKNKQKLKKLALDQSAKSSANVVPATPDQLTTATTTEKTSTIKKKVISSSRRQLFSSSTDDDEENSSSEKDDQSEDFDYHDFNLIINIQKILCLVNSMNCPKCNSQASYEYKVTKRLGLSYYISFICSCGHTIRLSTGTRIENPPKSQMTDLNMLCILAGSLVGLRRTGLQKFFGAMGILPPVQIESYKRYENLLFTSIRQAAEKSTEFAADEARAYHKSDDIGVSIDGTWLTQGFSSLHGVGTILSVADPPKVLDFEVMTRHCSTCAGLLGIKEGDGELYTELLEKHLESGCESNYDGSSGGMEGAAMVEMFSRSISKHNLRYTSYIADGDTKNDVNITQSKPYGDCPLIRRQCINHFSKRMKTRLMNIKKKYGRTHLPDNKTIGGKGRLDDARIYRLQIYFGKAIRDNINDLEKMKQAAWSAWYHMASTDDHPMHDLCDPKHCNVYLDFNYRHESHSVPPAVCAAIKPAYEELCREESLQQVLGGGTTNANESFHRIIWSLCSKKRFHTRMTIGMATNLATIIYNDGFNGVLSIYRLLGIHPNSVIQNMMARIDHQRIKEDQSMDPSVRLDQRRKNRLKKLHTEEKLIRDDPYKYGPGIAD